MNNEDCYYSEMIRRQNRRIKKRENFRALMILVFILVFVLLCILFGCSTQNLIKEDKLYVTRAYAGNFISEVCYMKGCTIYTDKDIFHVYEHLYIAKNARCYLQLKEMMLPGSNVKIWKTYFTFDGTDKLYEVKTNWITGDFL